MWPIAFAVAIAGQPQNSRIETRELAQVSQCPPRRFDERSKGYVGGSSLVGSDGRSFFLECGDGRIRRWREGDGEIGYSSASTVFSAAQQAGTVPLDLKCIYPLLDPAGLPPPDCRVEARSPDGRVFIVREGDTATYAIAIGMDRPLLEFDTFDTPIGFLGKDVVVANNESVPGTLQRVDLANGSRRTLAKLPSSNLIFENGEGSPSDAGYAGPHRLFVISFSGAFRVARSMVYLSAFGLNGRRRWQLEAPLPDDDGNLITGEFTVMRLVDGGRHAAVARTSDRSKTEIVEVATGRKIGSVAGWLVDGAADAPRLLLSNSTGRVRYIELSLKSSKRRTR